MEIIKCINCKKDLEVPEIRTGITAKCECGCIQVCMIIYDDNLAGWRVINPYNIKR